jgi:hypothetical protein
MQELFIDNIFLGNTTLLICLAMGVSGFFLSLSGRCRCKKTENKNLVKYSNNTWFGDKSNVPLDSLSGGHTFVKECDLINIPLDIPLDKGPVLSSVLSSVLPSGQRRIKKYSANNIVS